MTAARSTRDSQDGQDTDDFDVEEALALVKGAGARPSGEPGGAERAVPGPQGTDPAAVPSPGARNSGEGKPTRHRSTPWPEARAVAERAARSLSRRTPVPVPLDASLGLVLAAP